MKHGNEVNHGKWERGKSWDIGMRLIIRNGKEVNHGT